MSEARIALDVSHGRLGRIGISVYIWRLHEALAALLGERLVPIASRFARPVLGARRTAGERMATLGRDLWWHQAGPDHRIVPCSRYRARRDADPLS